jgi:hypothetical protein
MHKTFKLGLVALALALPLAACDSDEEIVVDVQTFAANLASVNSQLGTVTGTATFEIVEDQMRVTINATGLDSLTHMQFVGSGRSCPTAAADISADGVVDVVEGQPSWGPFLLALDQTLSVRRDTIEVFPIGTSLAYQTSAQLSAVENSLRGAPTGFFRANLPVNGNFNPDGLTVIILGDTGPFPPTVNPLETFPANVSIPVACGVINRVLQ